MNESKGELVTSSSGRQLTYTAAHCDLTLRHATLRRRLMIYGDVLAVTVRLAAVMLLCGQQVASA